METRELVWLEMMKNYGLSEIPGPIHNQTIISWFFELGFPWIKDDETAWCSLALNIAAKHAGCEYTGKLDARSWLKIGTKVIEPKIGHVVVFGLKGSWKGHVGLYAGYNELHHRIFTLGGNQGNKICISPYLPKNDNGLEFLGYRELKLLK